MNTIIYVLTDAAGEIRYVGKTKNDVDGRLYSHVYNAKHGSHLPVAYWIRKQLRNGMMPNIKMINVFSGDGAWEEIGFISYYRRIGVRLLNCTDGGEGTMNLSPSARERKRLAQLGKKRSAATRENIRNARIGMKHSDSAKRHMKENWTPRDPWNNGKRMSNTVKDKMLKTRARKSKYTAELIIAVRNDSSGMTQHELGIKYGISQGAVSVIRAG